jgi:RND family efflux transporter MFP subunit
MKKYLMLAAALVFMFSCGKQNEKKHSDHKHTTQTIAHNHSSHNHKDHDHKDHEGHDHKHDDKKSTKSTTATKKTESHSHNHEAHNHEAHDHNHEGHNHEGHNHEGHDHGNPNEIVFTKAQAKVAGLQTEVVSFGDFTRVIRTSGEILTAVGAEQVIVAKSSGIVSFVKSVAVEGAAVNSKQKLASISSRNLSKGDQYVQIKAEYEAAEKAYNRDKKLKEDNIVSAKDYERSRAAYLAAKSRYDAISGSNEKSGVTVVSPISGYLKSRLVTEGDFVEEGTPIAVVTQTRRLQLRAEVPEKYYAELRNVKSANFTTTYDDKLYKLAEMNGRLLSYGRNSADGAFYVPVTFEFDNCGDVLPGAFVEIYLLADSRHHVITLPLEAISEQQGVKFVYIKLDEECYQKQEVKTGLSDGERIEILSGLEEGQEVVTRGVTQVRLAASASVVPEGHSHSH